MELLGAKVGPLAWSREKSEWKNKWPQLHGGEETGGRDHSALAGRSLGHHVVPAPPLASSCHCEASGCLGHSCLGSPQPVHGHFQGLAIYALLQGALSFPGGFSFY